MGALTRIVISSLYHLIEAKVASLDHKNELVAPLDLDNPVMFVFVKNPL
jgi:hypothetical protein